MLINEKWWQDVCPGILVMEQGVLLKLKGKLIKQSALLHGYECWDFKKDHRMKMGVAELWIDEWMGIPWGIKFKKIYI